MKIIKKIFTTIIFITLSQVQAQEILSKEEAILITLENNYNIKLSKDNLEIAENNTSVMNSGYLPKLYTQAGATYDENDAEFTVVSGDKLSRDDVKTRNYNASIGINYVLFNGLGRYYTNQKLQETYNLSEIQARNVMENTLLTLFQAYYEVARLTENFSNQKENLEISKQRLKRADYAFEYGQNTKLDVLNAIVDVNNDSINYLSIRRQLANSKRDLNIVLGREVNSEVFVDTTVTFLKGLKLDSILKNSMKLNSTYLQIQKSLELAAYDVKINNSGWMPMVSLTSSYAWSHRNNDPLNEQNPFSTTGTVNKGLNAGVSMSWNLFDGGSTSTRVKNAKISLDKLETEKEQQADLLNRDVNNAWESYQNTLFILKVQKTNVEMNKLNFDRTLEYYKLGQISSIDFRLAQVNLINAKLTVSLAKYAAKNAELLLLQLSGNLIGNNEF